MHLRRITEFFFDRRRCRRLDELAESRARIRKTPGRQLDLELVERLPRLFHQTVFITLSPASSRGTRYAIIAPELYYISEFAVCVASISA